MSYTHASRHCYRCGCSVPLSEWLYIDNDGYGVFRHVGLMRDGDQDRYVVPDPDAVVTWCNARIRVPEKV